VADSKRAEKKKKDVEAKDMTFVDITIPGQKKGKMEQ
jgi:hypothetical protein